MKKLFAIVTKTTLTVLPVLLVAAAIELNWFGCILRVSQLAVVGKVLYLENGREPSFVFEKALIAPDVSISILAVGDIFGCPKTQWIGRHFETLT